MAKPPAATPTEKVTLITRAKTFYDEVMAEMSKVAWPQMDEIKSSTSVIMLLLAIIGAIIYVFDAAFQFAVLQILKLG